MAKASSGILMEIVMKANLSIPKLMVMASIFLYQGTRQYLATNTKEIGNKTKSTEKAQKPWMMVQST